MLLELVSFAIGAVVNGVVLWKVLSLKIEVVLPTRESQVAAAVLGDYKKCDSCKLIVARFEEQAGGTIKCANCIAEGK